MQHYANSVFDLTAMIPSNWSLVTWSHGNIPSDRRDLYQASDHDLPTAYGNSKLLFTACLHRPESQASIAASIEVSLYRVNSEDDFGRDLRSNLSNQGDRVVDEGEVDLSGLVVQYVDVEYERSDAMGRVRFAYGSLKENLLLYAKIAGDGPDEFAIAESAFRKFHRTTQ